MSLFQIERALAVLLSPYNQERRIKTSSVYQPSEALTAYATIALADPKAPFEFRAMGPKVWTGQVSALILGLYLVDPLRLREGGLDDIWYSAWNPIYQPITEKVSKAGDWFFDAQPPPSPWDFW